MNNKNVKSILRCLKCKSDNLFIREIWANHSIEWEQTEGSFDRSYGTSEPGNPFKLECSCKDCKHKWKVRKYWQIDHIIQHK